MAPKPVKVKIPNLTKDFQTAIKILTKTRPKVSAADKKVIDLEIRQLKCFETTILIFCKSKMTHAFDPAGGDSD
jgi:hypothetical protein